MSLIDFPGSTSDILTSSIDPNPIFNYGRSRSSTGTRTASKSCTALGIEFIILPLDCTEIWYGYGHKCRYAEIIVEKWHLPATDLY